MRQLIATEFDSIVSKEVDDPRYHYLEKAEFDKLIALIADDKSLFDFFTIHYHKQFHEIITIKNYVGLFQLKELQLQIYPKIMVDESKDLEKTKEIFLKMISSLKDFPHKVIENSTLDVKKMNLYEIFISLYLGQVRYIVKKGMRFSYVETKENKNYFKGKLLVPLDIKYNLIHKERFYVSFTKFHPNRVENQIIKSTLLWLLKRTTNQRNFREIKQLLVAFEHVNPMHSMEDFKRVQTDKNLKDYVLIIKWSKIFLLGESFVPFSGNYESVSLLFPMEKLFESYVAQHVKKIFSSFKISIQDQHYYLFEQDKKFALRPDIVMRYNDKIYVIDTKWKLLIDDKHKNYGISQSDMYQMYAYAKKYHTNQIWLLYPYYKEMSNSIQFTSDDGVCVHIFFVKLDRIDESLENLKQQILRDMV